jgi:hypothetical protein
MSKTESTIVGVFLAGICPLLVFVGCWWSAYLVLANVPGVPVTAVIAAAMSGLVVGIVLDLLLLQRWIRKFYTASLWLMAAIYGALCVVAVAFFMGLPVGTFGLGLLAGIYAGRRQHHAAAEGAAIRRGLRRVALFAAMLTAGAALLIGILVLQEQSVIELLGSILGLAPSAIQGATGVMVVCLLCVVLFAAQYFCSLQAGWLAFRMGAGSAQQGIAPPEGASAHCHRPAP